MSEEDTKRIRDGLWAGYIITQEDIEQGYIPVEHLEGSPEWRFCPHTRSWYNDARAVELCQQLAIKRGEHNRPGYEPDEPDGQSAQLTMEYAAQEWRYITRVEALPDNSQDDGLPLFSLDTAVEGGVGVEVYDQGGRTADVMSGHMAQLRFWGNDAEANRIGKDLEDAGIIVAEMTWEPPIPLRESGLICTNCGLDRGMQALCESCHEAAGVLHVVDGRIVK